MSSPRSDLLLSSGFLGFARHLGFLRAASERRLSFEAIVGTSSGAIVGALFAAGRDWSYVRQLLGRRRPLSYVALSARPWAGLCTLRPLLRVLERELPDQFEQLATPLAVGVVAPDGTHRLITHGALRPAVLASCSIRGLCVPTVLEGRSHTDGGAVDRLGVAAWRMWRPDRNAVLHRIERRLGVEPPADLCSISVVTSPCSRASLLSWKDFDRQLGESYELAMLRLGLLFPGGISM